MQVVVNLASDQIVSTGFEPEVGGTTVVNGKYLFVTPPGVALTVDSSSYLIPQDSGSLPFLAAAELLVRFPMYDHVLYNYLLEDADVADIDVSSGAPQPASGNVTPASPGWDVAGLVGGPNGPRCQVGRGSGPPLGLAPGSVAILSRNDNRTLGATYGSLVTDTEDLTPFNPGNPGTDDVMMWWEVARVSTSEDVVSGFGTTAGLNTPSLRNLEKIDQEPADFYCYVSVDDGLTWYEADYLQPLDLASSGTDLRIAFINAGTEKLYLLGFAMLFQDLPP